MRPLNRRKTSKPRYHSKVFIMIIDNHRWQIVSSISAAINFLVSVWDKNRNTTDDGNYNDVGDIFPTHIYSLFILLTVNKLFQSSLSFPHVLMFKRHITDRISITKLIKNLEEYLPSFPKVLLASDIMGHTNAQLYH